MPKGCSTILHYTANYLPVDFLVQGGVKYKSIHYLLDTYNTYIKYIHVFHANHVLYVVTFEIVNVPYL